MPKNNWNSDDAKKQWLVGQIGADEGRQLLTDDVQNTLTGENFTEWKQMYATDGNFEGAYIAGLESLEQGYTLGTNNCNSSTHRILSIFGVDKLPMTMIGIDVSWYYRIDVEPTAVQPLPPLSSSNFMRGRASSKKVSDTLAAKVREAVTLAPPPGSERRVQPGSAPMMAAFAALNTVFKFNGRKTRADEDVGKRVGGLSKPLLKILKTKLGEIKQEHAWRLAANSGPGVSKHDRMPTTPVLDVDTTVEWVSVDWT